MADDLKTPYDDDPVKREIYLRGAADAASQKNKPLTVADIKAMSKEEIADRMPEVREALKSKPANTDDDNEGDGGDDD